MTDPVPPVTDNGKLWAAISYGSFFVGFPLGVIPLLQRDDAYALHHAKSATAVWLAVFVMTIVLAALYTVLTVVTCGFGAMFFPMLLVPVPWALLVGIHGIVLSLNGEWTEPLGVFGLGEKLFASIHVKSPDELPGPPPPPPADPPASG